MSRIFLSAIISLLFLNFPIYGQYLFSSSANGNSAFLASRLESRSLAANPAFLGWMAPGTNYVLQTEINSKTKDPFDPDFPDLEFWIPVSARFRIGVRKIFGFRNPSFLYIRWPHDEYNIPVPSYYDPDYVEFSYQQGWSYALGMRIHQKLSAGVSLRHASYLGTGLHDEYLSLDAGSLYQIKSCLNVALVMRDLFPCRIETSERHYTYYYELEDNLFSDPVTGYWDVNQWENVRVYPVPYAEMGLSYMFKNKLEMLVDFSTRKEYAWGLRLRFSPHFSLFGGNSQRYDHILKDQTLFSGSMGAQIRVKFVTFVASVVKTRQHYMWTEMQNIYGHWSGIHDVPREEAIFSLGFTF